MLKTSSAFAHDCLSSYILSLERRRQVAIGLPPYPDEGFAVWKVEGEDSIRLGKVAGRISPRGSRRVLGLIFCSQGGNMNGTTDNDRTTHFEALPKNQLDLALYLESDRMRALAVTPENLDNPAQRSAGGAAAGS